MVGNVRQHSAAKASGFAACIDKFNPIHRSSYRSLSFQFFNDTFLREWIGNITDHEICSVDRLAGFKINTDYDTRFTYLFNCDLRPSTRVTTDIEHDVTISH